MAASYPNSIVSLATHSDTTDTIFAADVNTPNAEIVAVETGLLNGFQHDLLPLTDDTRSLGSTSKRWLKLWTQDLDLDGTLTLPAGTVSAPTLAVGTGAGIYSAGANLLDLETNGVKAVEINATQVLNSPTQPRCLAFNNTTQSLTNATDTALTFNTESYNVGALHSTGTNPTRFTVPTGGDGLYFIKGTYVPAAASGDARAFLRKNGTTALEGTAQRGVLNASFQVTFQCATLVVLAATDYVELIAYQSSGGALNTGDAAAPAFMNAMFVVKLW